MKILHLTLKRKWFTMILHGEKREEYRELTEYWASRILYKIPLPLGGYMSAWSDIKNGHKGEEWKKRTGNAPVFEKFDIVRFRNGYQKDSPTFDIEFKGIEIKTGNPEWGAVPGMEYFVIKLGEIVNEDQYLDACIKLATPGLSKIKDKEKFLNELRGHEQ